MSTLEHTVMQKKLTLLNCDCLTSLKTLPDNSIDLIVTDPPYYKVKRDAWDNQWATQEEFLSWLDCVALELWRVLKPSGTLYLFCSSRLGAETELLLKQRFDVLSHIVWTKPSGPWNRACKETLRAFFPATERIIMCGHYGSEGLAKGASNYHLKCQDLKSEVFAPLINYFKDAKARLNVPAREINKATGTQMSSHWFSSS
ncbi:DNA-methyltransferase, partial [Shewanella sp. D64]|uniref:DNA-methyltransferase n=1 Tax=Shewanella sp. D64 TaxID=392163 RepID=UPI002DD63E96